MTRSSCELLCRRLVGDRPRHLHNCMPTKRGFTLIELLVVIAIIGMLSSVILASLNTARQKARDARRLSDMKQIQTALELYYDTNRAYPNSGGAWRSQCSAWGGVAADQVIPGLVPTYMPSFPADPSMNVSANTCCYLYLSNGTDFKFLDHNCPSEINYLSQPTMIDPQRDSGPDVCKIDGAGVWAWALSTPGGNCW